MREHFPLLILSVLLLSACSDERRYTLTGTLPGTEYNDKTIYLTMGSVTGVPVDSAIVKDGKFRFTGAAPDSVLLAFVSPDADHDAKMFVVEPGDIQMIVDTSYFWGYKISGGNLNNEYQSYKDSLAILYQNSWKFGKEMQAVIDAGKMEGDEAKKWELKKDSILNEIEDHVYDFIAKHARNSLGEGVFFSDTYFFRPAKLEKLIPLLRPDFDGVTPEMEARINAWKGTAVGQPYADVGGFDINGDKTALSDYVGKGNVVVIDFWASWCGPCVRALPGLKDFYEKNKDKGLVVLGVSLDDDSAKWIEATKKHNITWPQLSNLKGWDDPAAISYGINLIPRIIMIDKNGIIAANGIGVGELQYKFDELTK